MTNINIRTDEDVKKEAEELFEALGLNLTTAINMFLKKAIRENGIPFDVSLNVPNAITRLAMEESDRLAEDKTSVSYSSVESLRSLFE